MDVGVRAGASRVIQYPTGRLRDLGGGAGAKMDAADVRLVGDVG